MHSHTVNIKAFDYNYKKLTINLFQGIIYQVFSKIFYA